MRRRLGGLLAVGAADQEFRAGPAVIAEKVNQIGNRRARVYWLRITHDVYLSEYRRLGDGAIFGLSQQQTCRDRFLPVYKPLIDAIRIDA